MRYIELIIATIIVLMSLLAHSNDLTPQRVQLIYKVAKEAKIDANDLIRVAYVESHFRVNAIRNNKNGTIDYGMFQINSVHWNTTCKAYNITVFNGNVRCAAKLIKEAQVHSGYDSMWLARYHSKTPSKKVIYNDKLNDVPNFELADSAK